ncbi:MAG TPA: hypothetical protein VLF17_01085 [Candidatus Nitrosotenuis sp.]|nr:hypothetical protein [Candidatus Nitrosotenuis sp.]
MKSFESGSLEKDLGKVRGISLLVKKKILESNPKYEQKIAKMSGEELEDLDMMLGLAEQILIKYQHKTDTYAILKEFADLIRNSTLSLGTINDQVQELILSAQFSVSEIKTAQGDVSSSLSFDKAKPESRSKEGRINLTNSATPVYTQAYQQSSQVQYEQVI